MTSPATAISVEDSSPKPDEENDILSSTRIKQRRATVAPTEIPTAKLPRYLRDPGRYGNRTRRQSMPAQYISSQPLPCIRLATEKSSIGEEIDKTSDNEIQTRSPKSPVKLCKSFPLDYRLQSEGETSSTLKLNSSSGTLSKASTDLIIPEVGKDNNGHNVDELELIVGFRSSPYKERRTLHVGPSPMHTDRIRRHSIAVSKISESNRIRSESSLPGMTGLENIESSLCKSRDRIISLPSHDDVESGRNNPDRKTSRGFVPKPDNHLVLSLFSCICCPLIGVAAVIFSIQVDRNYEDGKKEASVSKSKNARYLALSAVIIGMFIILGASLYGVLVLANIK